MKKAYKSKNREHRIAILNYLISEDGNMVYNTYAYGKMNDYYYIDKGVIKFSEELPTGYVEAFLNEKEAISWWLWLANADKVELVRRYFPESHYKGLELSQVVDIFEKEKIVIEEFSNIDEHRFSLFIDKILTWISKILR